MTNRAGLQRLLRARLRSDEEADDVLQELYLRLQPQAEITGIDNPSGYLFRMALNLARDHRRGLNRARQRDEDWAQSRSQVLGAEAVADLPAADDAYASRQELLRLVGLIAALPPQCRLVFTLHKLEGFSHADIAARLNISRSAVEKHMNTALKRLARPEDRAGEP